MKYCPNCRAEYHDHVTTCHECGVQLVGEVPSEPAEGWKSVDPVVVHTAAATIDAELIVGSLKANGIRAFAAGTGAEVWTEAGQIGQMTRIPGPLNAIRIMVHPDDAAQARDVLAAQGTEPVEPQELIPGMRWTLDPNRRARVVKLVALLVLAPILWATVIGIVELVRNV